MAGLYRELGRNAKFPRRLHAPVVDCIEKFGSALSVLLQGARDVAITWRLIADALF